MHALQRGASTSPLANELIGMEFTNRVSQKGYISFMHVLKVSKTGSAHCWPDFRSQQHQKHCASDAGTSYTELLAAKEYSNDDIPSIGLKSATPLAATEQTLSKIEYCICKYSKHGLSSLGQNFAGSYGRLILVAHLALVEADGGELLSELLNVTPQVLDLLWWLPVQGRLEVLELGAKTVPFLQLNGDCHGPAHELR